MAQDYIEEKRFEGEDFSTKKLPIAVYDSCTFVQCNFLNADFTDIIFAECEFKDCDLSNAEFEDTGFKTVTFSNCKMLGLHFENCNDFLFAIQLKGTNISFSSFDGVNLEGTSFADSRLHEVDFSNANLVEASFDNCDLYGSVFDQTQLEKCDFRTSYNYSIDPEMNQLKKAKFSRDGLEGLLGKYGIEVEG